MTDPAGNATDIGELRGSGRHAQRRLPGTARDRTLSHIFKALRL